jgi:hypothetical protein
MPLEALNNSANIITGSAYLFQAPVSTALITMPPTDNSVNDLVAAIITAAVWQPLGYTDAGIKFAYDPTYKDITVDEQMSPVDSLMTAEKLVVSCSLAELTLTNLARVISTAAAPAVVAAAVGTAGTTTFQQGGQQVTNKFAYLLVGMGPRGFLRMVNVYNAVATSKLDMQYKRGEKLMTPVEFTALALSSNGVGNRLFQVVDKSAQGE